MRIVLDENKCSSLGMCESVAPDFFEVGDDGALKLLNPTPPGAAGR
ncbi:ferredoxin [Klenkia terrae]